MASPHSLNFSFPSSPTLKRNSLSQLPLPTGMSTPPTINPQLVTPNPNIIPASAVAKLRNPGSPVSSTFPVTQTYPMHTSSTHAGGVQPSASFFRPSRPHYSPPDSPSSSHMPAQDENDVFQLSDLKRHSDSTADHSELVHGDTSDLDQQATKGIKQSREPLLPIGEGPRVVIRTSMVKDRSDSNHAVKPQLPHSRSGLRTSLDLVLNLRRGLSIDSHKSASTPSPAAQSHRRNAHSTSSEGFGSIGGKRKLHDVERGYPTTHFASLKRHSIASSHDPSSFATTQKTSGSAPIPAGYKPRLRNAQSSDEKKQYIFAVPMYTPRGQIIRKWQLHPSRNNFYLRGHILTGGDSPWAFIVSFAVLCAIAGLWFGTTCQWWWLQEGAGGKVMVCIGGYLASIVISSMLKTAFTDPGILPRNLDPDPPYPAILPADGGARAPMPRDLKVRADVVRVKYCPTCKTYRPPRSSHCKMCDNCVDGCDHHCQWVNNCVGRRNYTTFFVLLLTATITLLLVIATSVAHLYFLTKRGGPGTDSGPISFKQAISSTQGAGSAAAFCLSAVVIWPVAALLSYHIRLLFLNITTIEQIRNQAHKTLVPGPAPPNPFSHGSWRRNMMAVLCRSPGYSWLDPSAIATEDRREINPGSTVAVEIKR
ncbi:DHHC palmitoyltransferase-domain-containing protein [Lentinula boryana]|uniref:Palmitoyltransferase n=1 Tax=Lentinula boryana TaxID=40481 RepID=A0ABQ8Q4M1_9AGAR|nr:DHHC palmitoyltransferase-domain-containing protein [Lentinula boryana]